jgi:AraC-like DNA-binding protein
VDGAAHPELRPLLDRGYAGFTETTEPSRLVLPATTSVPLVLKLRDSAHRPPAFVHGAHGAYSVMEGACAPSYLEIWLAPLGAYTLLGVPMEELRGGVVDLAAVLGVAGRDLAERVRDAATWHRRFEIVDEFLLRRSAAGPNPSPEVAQAWRRLVLTAGEVRIKRVATEVGWSHKHLITRFKQQVGVSPKMAARLVRFERVLCSVTERVLGHVTERPARWSEVAATNGYADQAHLVRDFREFTGMTPTEFAAGAGTAGRHSTPP